MSSSDTAKNKRGFDLLFEHKEEIEEQIGTSDLNWDRANENKASWITYTLKGVSVTNEADWPRMAKFHAEWSAKIADAMIPYLTDLGSGTELSPEKAAKNNIRLNLFIVIFIFIVFFIVYTLFFWTKPVRVRKRICMSILKL